MSCFVRRIRGLHEAVRACPNGFGVRRAKSSNKRVSASM